MQFNIINKTRRCNALRALPTGGHSLGGHNHGQPSLKDSEIRWDGFGTVLNKSETTSLMRNTHKENYFQFAIAGVV